MSYFTKETVKFFRDLDKNNNKEWFDVNRDRLNQYVLDPAKVFVLHMGDMLREIAPGVQAIPKTDKSIFRLHRDTRFSKNKSPYKTNLGMLFWEGPGKKLECSGFYMHVEPKLYYVGVGFYMFTPEHMKKFREIVYNPNKAKELLQIFQKLEKKGYKINDTHYKTVPRGFDKEYKYADLLKFNGLYTYYESKNMKELLEAEDQIEFIFKKYKDISPLHYWLLENMS